MPPKALEHTSHSPCYPASCFLVSFVILPSAKAFLRCSACCSFMHPVWLLLLACIYAALVRNQSQHLVCPAIQMQLKRATHRLRSYRPYGWHHSSNGMGKVQMKCRNEEPSGTWILGLEREWTCTFYAIAVSAVMGLFASVNALSKPSILTSICTAGFILPWMNAG